MVAGQRRQQHGRKLALVGEGLIVDLRQLFDRCERGVRVGADLRVRRTEMARHRPRLLGPVVTGIAEADREGHHRAVGDLLHERHDRGRIDAAGEECAERHIGHHAALDRAREQPVQLVGR